MDERYPFGRGVTWARTIRCLAIQEPAREHECFFEHLDMFAGADENAPDPTMERMVAAIVAHGSNAKRDDGNDSE